jgi:Flp pilus assembly protein TadG
MKPQFVIILLILVGILGFIVGYSIAPTDVSVVRHGAPEATTSSSAGHEEASGGYGSAAPESGGYGAAPAASGGYGASAPAAGGYGAPASGGYGH